MILLTQRSLRLLVTIMLSLAALSAPQPIAAQIKIEGSVINSVGKPVPGVLVSIYVLGDRDPVETVRTDKGTGGYKLTVNLSGAFDISHTHSRYDTAVVPSLAHRSHQNVSKVLYQKGEPRPPDAGDETYSSIRRLILLASALTPDEIPGFSERFGLESQELWDRLAGNVREIFANSVPPNLDRFLLRQQAQTLNLRSQILRPR